VDIVRHILSHFFHLSLTDIHHLMVYMTSILSKFSTLDTNELQIGFLNPRLRCCDVHSIQMVHKFNSPGFRYQISSRSVLKTATTEPTALQVSGFGTPAAGECGENQRNGSLWSRYAGSRVVMHRRNDGSQPADFDTERRTR
jgi:hypothetical protein